MANFAYRGSIPETLRSWAVQLKQLYNELQGALESITTNTANITTNTSDITTNTSAITDLETFQSQIDPNNEDGGRTSYSITNNPSNLSSGGTKIGYYQRIGDAVTVSIMISSYTSSSITGEIQWDCLPYGVVGNRQALSCAYYHPSSGFRWVPGIARLESGTTARIMPDGGATSIETKFGIGTMWLIITGTYFVA